MSEPRPALGYFVAPGRRWKLTLALLSLGALAITLGLFPRTALSDPNTCPETYGCTWGQPNFDGARDVLDGPTYGGLGWFQLCCYNRNSAKNNYNARKLHIGRPNGSGGINELKCMDPGEVAVDPGYFYLIKISNLTNDHCG